ncbi:Pimeloyl-ACP methyl ester carboxylesterase [Saccharopolyspora antimicrobica]|uniref:Pimeloyl-ACP methyl ester carboxylesterase n=1 Tax=Saccharopolyspora antimicrobica TaxID=455193 RepID=A0A1I5CKJ4_9PSEU|nr:alpha/beta hydrolase [Saccharopolyspora antimicrobica]RKT88825.1 pimeloyl-ACP methyl ester carboxylesterase [Saccharopolyspora antimicrobica]SFN87519.1 Pimeloyl-ACP methyl ester carboxylesterase [Saccharopolyspora antimicrobica]
MTDVATAANHSCDQNSISRLPLHDLAGFTHRWVDAEGIRLHAVEGGQPTGPVVVLLAGFPQTWWAWRKAMPGLAERFHVIAIDLPGQGHSDRPHDSYDTHTVASRVQAAVAALNVPKYWLVAHDIGAWVAFSLALKYEERLHGVALLDAGIPGITLPEAIPTDPAQAWKTWHFAFHLVPDLPETLLAGRERAYVDWFLQVKALSPNTFDSAEIDHYAAAVAAEGGLRASLAYYRDAAESARKNHDALGRQHLTVPVLGISSSHGSIPDMAASISPWADNATGVVIPDAGHFIPDEQPDAVVDALTAFIDRERVG